ncbi:ABC transporter permease [Listeria riparia]|uniref:ABC transporter permease n=1 Tax=Listeria riparia FSL S10-1204 TaxID=1265816 RepID=W7CZR3_9LIST|nr:ABC transporter permease [Listeria riparia]EUJ42427.1 ABC transporter permease [Listeria riparia FSL S10-1204]
MIGLIRADSYRLTKGKMWMPFATLIVIAVAVAGLIYLALNVDWISLSQDGAALTDADKAILTSSLNGTQVAQIVLSFSVVLAMGFISILTNLWSIEFSAGVAKNVLVSGVSRTTFYFSKLLTGWGVATLMLLVYTVAIGISSQLFMGGVDFGNLALGMLAQIPLYLGLITVGYFIFIIIPKESIAIVTYILVYLFLEPVVTNLVNVFLPKWTIIKDMYLFSKIGVMSNLSALSQHAITTNILTGFAYMVVFAVLGWLVFRFKEVK